MERVVEYSTLSYLIPLILTAVTVDSTSKIILSRVIGIYGISFVIVFFVLSMLLALSAYSGIVRFSKRIFHTHPQLSIVLTIVLIVFLCCIAIFFRAFYKAFMSFTLDVINAYTNLINKAGVIGAISLENVLIILSCAFVCTFLRRSTVTSALKYATVAYVIIIFWALNIAASISTLALLIHP